MIGEVIIMAAKRDFYEVLGIDKNADEATIKKAYRKLAKKYHPDMNKGNPNAEKIFQEVTEAYEVLGDPKKRKLYDEYGPISLEAGFDPEKMKQAQYGNPFGNGGFYQSYSSGEPGNGYQEFHFDGFRFDGVTSMLYYSHGLGEAFTNYADYFNGHQDDNAICYLTLANRLIHEVNPHAITIAEEVSGMPGLAARFEDGGYGFDYRMAMNIPDYWIKTIKERRDEDWKPSSIFWEVKNRRSDERTISYCESHDQALVGDKTIIFRLVDADMYWHFRIGDENEAAHRGIALHKMIRLVTLGAINGGYLNFMGNEFGHPEWIDFPREGNGWSHKYARRQWNLVDDKTLCYHYLGDFDRRMLEVVKSEPAFNDTPVEEIWHNDGDQVLAYERGSLLFVFNFSPSRSYSDYGLLVREGSWQVVLNTDAKEFGGNGLADDSVEHLTNSDTLYAKDHKGWLKLYIPARSAVVLRKKNDAHA